MSQTPRVVNIDRGKKESLCGELVLRGEVAPRASLEIFGDAKLGRFLDLKSDAQVKATPEEDGGGGTLVLTPGFALPASGRFTAERQILFAKHDVATRESAFDNLVFTAPQINGTSLVIENTGKQVPVTFKASPEIAPGTPEMISGSKIHLYTLCGPLGGAFGFEQVDVKNLRNFLPSRTGGISARNIRCDNVEDVFTRSDIVEAQTARGELTFQPGGTPYTNTVWKLSDSKTSLPDERLHAGVSSQDEGRDLQLPSTSGWLDPRVQVSVDVVDTSERSCAIRVLNGDLFIAKLPPGDFTIEVVNGHLTIGEVDISKPFTRPGVLFAEKIFLQSSLPDEVANSIRIAGEVFRSK